MNASDYIDKLSFEILTHKILQLNWSNILWHKLVCSKQLHQCLYNLYPAINSLKREKNIVFQMNASSHSQHWGVREKQLKTLMHNIMQVLT